MDGGGERGVRRGSGQSRFLRPKQVWEETLHKVLSMSIIPSSQPMCTHYRWPLSERGVETSGSYVTFSRSFSQSVLEPGLEARCPSQDLKFPFTHLLSKHFWSSSCRPGTVQLTLMTSDDGPGPHGAPSMMEEAVSSSDHGSDFLLLV